jgi:hypothetical protein
LRPDDAWHHVTVILTDGWRHRGVTIQRDRHGAGLWLWRADGAQKLVPLERIASIYAADGAEITGAVLGGFPAPAAAPDADPPPPPAAPAGEAPDDPDVPGAATAGLFRVALGAEGGLASAAGDWYTGLGPGWGAGGRLRLTTHGSTYLGLGGRYQRLGVDGTPRAGADAHLDLLVLEATVGWVAPGAGDRSRPYLEMGAGMIEQSFTLTADGGQDTVRERHGSFVARAGVLVPLGGFIALDLGGTWNYKGLIFSDTGEADGSLLGVHLGLTWLR